MSPCDFMLPSKTHLHSAAVAGVHKEVIFFFFLPGKGRIFSLRKTNLKRKYFFFLIFCLLKKEHEVLTCCEDFSVRAGKGEKREKKKTHC